MRREIAYLVVLCGMVLICEGGYNNKCEKYIAKLEEAYVQSLPGNLERRYVAPELWRRKGSPNKYILYDMYVTTNGVRGGVKIVEFHIEDVPMLVESRIVLITDIHGTIVHCQFSSAPSSAEDRTAQSFYNSIRADLTVRFFATNGFNLVKVSKLVDENHTLVPVSGDVVMMKVHKLQDVKDAVMLRFVIELNGRDEPPFLVFTTTNSGISHIYDATDEMALEIWGGLFTKHIVFGYVITFYPADLPIFTRIFGQKFDELLSSLSQQYFVTEMSRPSGGGQSN